MLSSSNGGGDEGGPATIEKGATPPRESPTPLPPLRRGPPSGLVGPTLSPLPPVATALAASPPPLHQPIGGVQDGDDNAEDAPTLLTRRLSSKAPDSTSPPTTEALGSSPRQRTSWRQRSSVDASRNEHDDSAEGQAAGSRGDYMPDMHGERPLLRPSQKTSREAGPVDAVRSPNDEVSGRSSQHSSESSVVAVAETAEGTVTVCGTAGETAPVQPLGTDSVSPLEDFASDSATAAVDGASHTRADSDPSSVPAATPADSSADGTANPADLGKPPRRHRKHGHHTKNTEPPVTKVPPHHVVGPLTNMSISLPVPAGAEEETAVFFHRENTAVPSSSGGGGSHKATPKTGPLSLKVTNVDNAPTLTLDAPQQVDAENDGLVRVPYAIDQETFDVPLTCPDDHLIGRDRYWCPGKPLRVTFVTWNMAKKNPRMGELAAYCIHPNAHIVVVGTQENGPYIGSNKKQRRWVRETASECLKGDYTLVGEEHMWAIHLAVFARTRDVAQYVSHVDCSHVSTGLMKGLGGNKGGVAVALALSMVPQPIRDASTDGGGLQPPLSPQQLSASTARLSAVGVSSMSPDQGRNGSPQYPFDENERAPVLRSFEEWSQAPLPRAAGREESDPRAVWPPPVADDTREEAESSSSVTEDLSSRAPSPHPAGVSGHDAGSDDYSVAEVESVAGRARSRSRQHPSVFPPAQAHGQRHDPGVSAGADGGDTPSMAGKTHHRRRRRRRQKRQVDAVQQDGSAGQVDGQLRRRHHRHRSRHRQRREKREAKKRVRAAENAAPPSNYMTILCVTAHLAAHQGAIQQRNKDYKRIVRRLKVGYRGKHRKFFKELFKEKRRTYATANLSAETHQPPKGHSKGSSYLTEAERDAQTKRANLPLIDGSGDEEPAVVRARKRKGVPGYGEDLDAAARNAQPSDVTGTLPPQIGGERNVQSGDAAAATAAKPLSSGTVAASPDNVDGTPLPAESTRGQNSAGTAGPSSSDASSYPSESDGSYSDEDGSHLSDRDQEEVDIETLQLPSVAKHGPGPKTGNHRDVTEEYDLTLFGGDLNYRIEGTRRAIEYIVHHHKNIRSILMNNDQLTLERAKGTAFQRFQEGALFFRPTYKYEVSAGGGITLDEYNFSHKCNRLPAYCDRILYKKRRGSAARRVAIRLYTDVPNVRTSDHRPVVSIFDVETLACFDPI